MSSEQPQPARRPALRAARAVPVAVPRAAGLAPRVLAVLAAVLLALAVAVAGAARAQAHSSFLGSDPADGAEVATAPERVTLTFNEPAQALGTEIVITGPDGATVSDGAPELVDSTVTQALAGTLPAGAYTVTWRVTSTDGHPISGTFGFTASAEITIGQANPGPAATPDAEATEPEAVEPTVEPTEGAVIAPAPTESATPTTSEQTAEDEDAGLAAGAVAAIVVALLAAGAVAVFVIRERRRSAHAAHTDGGPADPTAGDRTQH